MMIVGLSGGIGSGKTTLADYLTALPYRSEHWESWQLIAEVAESLRNTGREHPLPDDPAAIVEWLKPLPAIVSLKCRKEVSFKQLRLTEANMLSEPEQFAKLRTYLELMQAMPELQVGRIRAENKEVFRSILQWLGGYLAATCGGDIWYGEIVRRIKQREDIDIAIIGGVRFPADADCITRAGGMILGIIRPDLASRDQDDPTERERNGIKTDATIYNDGTLEALQDLAAQLMRDILRGTLQKKYYAKAAK